MAEQITLAKFKVLMDEFDKSISVVTTQCATVNDTLDAIEKDFRSVPDLWNSPASNTFEPLRVEFKRGSDDLKDVLAGILHRMKVSYANYVEVERKAEQNLALHHPDDKTKHHQTTLAAVPKSKPDNGDPGPVHPDEGFEAPRAEVPLRTAADRMQPMVSVPPAEPGLAELLLPRAVIKADG